MAGEELSQSGDIFFEAQAQKSGLVLANKNSLLWYLTSMLTSSPVWDMLLLHCKSSGSVFLFNIVSIFTQILTSPQTLTHLLRTNETYDLSIKAQPHSQAIELRLLLSPNHWTDLQKAGSSKPFGLAFWCFLTPDLPFVEVIM